MWQEGIVGSGFEIGAVEGEFEGGWRVARRWRFEDFRLGRPGVGYLEVVE